MKNKHSKHYASEEVEIAMEAIKGDMTIADITAKYSVDEIQVAQCKKQLMHKIPECSDLYKQIKRLRSEQDRLKKRVDCLPGDKFHLLEPDHPLLSIRRQCQLLSINRSTYYYKLKKLKKISGNR